MANNWWDMEPQQDDLDQLGGEADFQRILRVLGYDKPAPEPQMRPSQGFRIPLPGGRGIPVSGRVLDSVAEGIATTPMPNNLNGAQGVAGGFAQGFARARRGQAQGRQKEYEAEQEKAKDFNSAAQRFKEQAALRMMTARGGAGGQKKMVKITPEIRKELEGRKIFLSSAVSELPEDSSVFTRDESSVDPSLVAAREALAAERRARQEAKDAQEAEDEALLEDYAEKVATFRIKPDEIPKRDPRWNAALQTRIDNKLFAKGSQHSLQNLDQLWRSTRKWLDTSNAQRAVNTRKAAMTVLDHIHQFEEGMDKHRDAYEKLPVWKKTELRLANKGIYSAALNGLLGPEAAADAAALEAVVQILPTEYATVLSGGFAPQKEQLEEARKVFNVAMGPQGHKGRTAAIRRLVKARVNNEQRNFSMIGGDKNPYLMEISKLEGWDLEKPLEPEAKKKGGFFDD